MSGRLLGQCQKCGFRLLSAWGWSPSPIRSGYCFRRAPTTNHLVIYRISDARQAHVFARLDADKSGKITLEDRTDQTLWRKS